MMPLGTNVDFCN